MKTKTGLTIRYKRTKDAMRVEVHSEKWDKPLETDPLMNLFANVLPNYYKNI